MKLSRSRLFTLFLGVVLATAAGCGSNQSSNPVVGLGGNSTIPPGSGIPPGATPIYSGSTLSGYKVHSYLVSGTSLVYAGSSFSQSVAVTAGMRVYFNPGAATYAEVGYCWGTLSSYYPQSQTYTLSGVSASLAGSPISSSVLVTTSGSVTLTATPSSISMDCGSLYNHRNAVAQYYYVSMGSSYFSGSAVLEADTCMNTSGSPMTCP